MAREILDFITFNCTPETADRLLAELEKLGITASFATPDEAEVLYLLKTAYILNEDTTPAWKKVIKKLDKEMASSSERVKALRQYWSDRLGVDDVTKIAGYDPQGRYSLMTSSLKAKREAGWRKQLRFDITDMQIERELKGYGLYHRLTDGSDLPEVLDAVLEHNGAMVSTVEKMRIGIPVGGMSPGSDMESGGASYFFTRIRKLPEKDGYGEAGLYFKPHLLRRMDAITYDSDEYGRVTGDHVRKHRKVRLEDYKRIAGRESSDETIFKNEVTLLDNLELITARNDAERKRALGVFRKHNITVLPDGRRVQDIVRTARH